MDPKDNAQLPDSVKDLLKQIGDVVEGKVSEKLKAAGLENSGAGIKIGGAKKLNHTDRVAYVKSILSDRDQAHMATLEGDEKQERAFLAKATAAYFFKNLVAYTVTKDPEYMGHVKALASGVDADGGYLVPDEFRAELIRDWKDEPVLRNFVTVIPMSTNYLELPTLVNDVKTSWGSENTSITTTTATFGNLTFTPYRLNTLMYVSRELVSDSALNIVSLLTTLFREAIGREEDRVIVNGSGTGQPKGIMAETLAGIDNGNVDADLATNIVKLTFRLPSRYRRNAKWLANDLALETIRALKDTTGRFLLGALDEGDGRKLAGFPVIPQNDLTVDALVFGDLSFYYLADREQISVETTTEGAGTFEKHQVAIKIVERIDGKVAQTNAFRKLSNLGVD